MSQTLSHNKKRKKIDAEWLEALLKAIDNNKWKTFCDMRINEHKDIINTSTRFWTLLQRAAYNGRTRMVRHLIHNGAHVNLAAGSGATPIFMASLCGHTDTVRTLAELHADVNKANKRGVTPLHTAACNGKTAVVQCLVEECHAVIHTRALDGETPMSDAKAAQHPDICQYFEQQMMNALMQKNVLPFCKDVLRIIIEYCPYYYGRF